MSGNRGAVTHPQPSPYRAAAILALLAQTLFCYRLTIPSKLMFDEVHYVPAARKLIGLVGPSNIEHPLLAKEIIAGGILLFGDNALGWRFFSTLAGTATVLGVFAVLWLMLGRVRPAVFGALFALFNFTLFVQARIAMLDGFMAAFTLLGIASLLWAMRADATRTAWSRWLLGSILLGLAVAAKWSAAPFVAYAGIAFVAVRLNDARARDRSVYAALNAGGHRHWPGMAAVPAILTLGAVSVTAYFLTFAPAFFYHLDPMTLGKLLPFQARMYAQQTQVLPSHPYQSPWWSWPFMVRPIWYLYEPADGAQRGVLLIGNLAILYGGLTAVAACLFGWWRDRSAVLLASAGLWIGSYAVWAVIPKSIGFFYYYYLPSIFLCIALAVALDHFKRGKRWDEAVLIVVLGLFVLFYPVLSAAPLSGPNAFHFWTWFPSWV
ncbi:phospholipid carrier-dependent glycosyltransferase [Sphingomonas psychrolutea]|uniref:phospholipid carrier-dependent glycosyltransferase n=1 Tax=Sphingomonas psychrolutea TaxID=1259676 RepID=UPI00166C5E30|nr:phospholipid carrier-dependent glycosyltransferase [Sphingomonas psychrolutea]